MKLNKRNELFVKVKWIGRAYGGPLQDQLFRYDALVHEKCST